MQATTKKDERAREFARAAWEGAEVVTAAGSRGVITNRWHDETEEGDRALVKFDDGTEAPVSYANLRAAPVACAFDVGTARAELTRRKPTPAICGKVYSPKLPTESERAKCPACVKIDAALRARLDRKYRREYMAGVRAARRTMPRLYEELKRINRAGRCWYLIPHVARSGMSRRIELFYPTTGGGVDVVWPDYEPGEGTTPTDLEKLRRRIDWSRRHRCFVVGGCGMDMVFATVDRLGHVFGFKNWGNKIRREGLSRAE